MLLNSSKIVFTLSCCITRLLLGTKKIATIHKKTSLHWVRLGLNYWWEIRKGDCEPSRQDVSGCRSISLIRDPPWHMMMEEQSHISALSPPFCRAMRENRQAWGALWLVAVPPSDPKIARPLVWCEGRPLAQPQWQDIVSLTQDLALPSWELQLPFPWAEQQHRAADFTSASSQSLVWVAQIWLWL